MSVTFTTWSDLYDKMLDDIASGSWKTLEYENGQGKKVKYRAWDDFKAALEYTKNQADKENTATGATPRTLAGNVRRFSS